MYKQNLMHVNYKCVLCKQANFVFYTLKACFCYSDVCGSLGLGFLNCVDPLVSMSIISFISSLLLVHMIVIVYIFMFKASLSEGLHCMCVCVYVGLFACLQPHTVELGYQAQPLISAHCLLGTCCLLDKKSV